MNTRRWPRARWYFFLLRMVLVQYLPGGAIERWQTRWLNRLLRHARLHVPGYAALFSNAGCPEHVASVKELSRFPIIHKSFFLARPTEEYTDTSRPLFSTWKKTSGTSGSPFAVLLAPAAFDALFVHFTRFRFLLQHGFSVTKLPALRLTRIDVRGPSSETQQFIQLTDFRREALREVKNIAAFGPTVLAAYTSILLDIARILEEHPDVLLRPPFVVSFGEMLSPDARSHIERVFGSPVYDQYGMTEVSGGIAVECDQHSGMHINSESVIVEVLDQNGNPLPEKVSGRIVVTDLMNYNMPFIRYDTGDHGSLIVGPCPCGLRTPRLVVDGRHSAYLTFGDKRIHHLEFDGALDGFMNTILQFQILKRSDERLVVRINPGTAFNPADAGRIRKKVQEITGTAVSVDIEVADSLQRTQRGKSKIVVDESVGTREN